MTGTYKSHECQLLNWLIFLAFAAEAFLGEDKMVSNDHISVVVSGPIFHGSNNEAGEFTALGCRSIREILPGAEIVLSTWEGEDVSGIDYDKLVLSKDPGANFNNMNRQICSRRAGIQAASREYVLAIRSESYLINDNFRNHMDQYELHGNDCVFLEHRIVIAASLPSRTGLFHIGDWYFFGHKADMLRFWDLPYCDDSQFNNSEDDILYNAHRYLITSFVRKYMPLQFFVKSDIHDENRALYEKIMAENFVITGFLAFGARSYKYSTDESIKGRLGQCHVSFTFEEWKKLYNYYCGGKLRIHQSIEELVGIYIYSGCLNAPKRFVARAKGHVWYPALRKLWHCITDKRIRS